MKFQEGWSSGEKDQELDRSMGSKREKSGLTEPRDFLKDGDSDDPKNVSCVSATIKIKRLHYHARRNNALKKMNTYRGEATNFDNIIRIHLNFVSFHEVLKARTMIHFQI